MGRIWENHNLLELTICERFKSVYPEVSDRILGSSVKFSNIICIYHSNK